MGEAERSEAGRLTWGRRGLCENRPLDDRQPAAACARFGLSLVACLGL